MELERTVERLRNEKRALVGQYQTTTEIEKYREERQFIEDSTLRERLWWLFLGR